jgi:hypothetical protein
MLQLHFAKNFGKQRPSDRRAGLAKTARAEKKKQAPCSAFCKREEAAARKQEVAYNNARTASAKSSPRHSAMNNALKPRKNGDGRGQTHNVSTLTPLR